MYHVVGTTCATALTQATLAEGCKSVSAGVNVMDLRSGINIAVGGVLSDLKKRALMISTPEEITQVHSILWKLFLFLYYVWGEALIYSRI